MTRATVQRTARKVKVAGNAMGGDTRRVYTERVRGVFGRWSARRLLDLAAELMNLASDKVA